MTHSWTDHFLFACVCVRVCVHMCVHMCVCVWTVTGCRFDHSPCCLLLPVLRCSAGTHHQGSSPLSHPQDIMSSATAAAASHHATTTWIMTPVTTGDQWHQWHQWTVQSH